MMILLNISTFCLLILLFILRVVLGFPLDEVTHYTNRSKYALPVYLSEPQNAWVSKNTPALLKCKVSYALKVYFSCNEKIMRSNSEIRGILENGLPFLEVSLEVKKTEVLDLFKTYTCKCFAQSEMGEVVSSEVSVSIARLSREFETPPYSQLVERGSQVELRCHAPPGNPPAFISHWLVNDKRIDSKLSNLLLTTPGHLIIQQADLNDTANYTCVASNGILERQSPPALISVYVGGEWSSWAEWSICNAQCGRGVMSRLRICSPATKGAPSCEGPSVQKKSCSQNCPAIDGKWSSWSSWSSCSSDCIQFRRRVCDNPAPKHDGNYCPGKNIASKNCSHGLCEHSGLHSVFFIGKEEETEKSDENDSSDLPLVLGLLFAFFVFIIAALLIIKILIRQNSGIIPASFQISSSSSNGLESEKETRDRRTIHYTAPDLTIGTRIVDNSNNSPEEELMPLHEPFYEQPMVDFSVKSSREASSESKVWKSLTNTGGSFAHPNNSFLVFSLPSGALRSPSLELCMSLNEQIEFKSNSWSNEKESLVSPIVNLGPLSAGPLLTKPFVLQIPVSSLERVSLLYSYASSIDSFMEGNWERIHENSLSFSLSRIHSKTICITTKQLGSFALVSSQLPSFWGDLSLGSSTSFNILKRQEHHTLTETLIRRLDSPTYATSTSPSSSSSFSTQPWISLSEALSLSHYNSFLSLQPSPSKALLDLWTSQTNVTKENEFEALTTVLRTLHRFDLLALLNSA